MAEPRQDRPQDASAPPAPRGTSPDLAATAADQVRSELDHLPACAARAERLPRHASDEGASRVRVPYSPFFLQQVRDGHVQEITSKGTAIQGTFKKKEQYEDSKPTDRFRTEIPAFADTRPLEAAPEQGRGRERGAARHRRAVVAEPPARLRPDDPVHRAARLPHAPGGQRAEHPRLVRAVAGQRYQPSERPRDVRGRRRDRRGEGRAVGGRRLPAPSREVPQARRHASRAACCSPARRAPARRCWRARSPARRTCRSSRCARPSSSRRSSAWARPACATCSRRRRRPRRRSSSSTSSTRSAARGRPASPASAAATTSASRR